MVRAIGVDSLPSWTLSSAVLIEMVDLDVDEKPIFLWQFPEVLVCSGSLSQLRTLDDLHGNERVSSIETTIEVVVLVGLAEPVLLRPDCLSILQELDKGMMLISADKCIA